jgi:hypothetical protein
MISRKTWRMRVMEKEGLKLRFYPTPKGWLMMEETSGMLMNRVGPGP